jgi:hypothetical protein
MKSTTTYNTAKKQEKNKSPFRFRSDRLIFIICILFASLFWLLIKLSDVYSVNYSFRVTYNNVPSALRLTKMVDSTLDLNLTARGFAILKMNIFNDIELLDINLDNYTIDHHGGVDYSILTQKLTDNLALIIGVNKKDIQFSKATLSFEMEKTQEKKVPVIPNYSLSFVRQYDLYSEVKTDPGYIMVYGPKNVLDTLYHITTKKLILENLMSDKVVKVELENPDNSLLSFDNDEVTMYFKVEKFTESEIEVPINLSNLRFTLKTFPSKVKIYYRVAQLDFNKVRTHQFNIFPVLNNMDILQVQKLPLKLSKQPDFIRNIRIVPSEVEFLIIK